MLRKAVHEQVAAMMVLPNKFPVQLIQDIPLKSLKFSPPAVSNFSDFNEGLSINKYFFVTLKMIYRVVIIKLPL